MGERFAHLTETQFAARQGALTLFGGWSCEF